MNGVEEKCVICGAMTMGSYGRLFPLCLDCYENDDEYVIRQIKAKAGEESN